jgi:hypothetical protein
MCGQILPGEFNQAVKLILDKANGDQNNADARAICKFMSKLYDVIVRDVAQVSACRSRTLYNSKMSNLAKAFGEMFVEHDSLDNIVRHFGDEYGMIQTNDSNVEQDTSSTIRGFLD